MEGQRPFEVVIPRIHSSSERVKESLSVNQALKYTPLTTSVLHSSDQVPFPSLARLKESARITSAAERKTISRDKCSPAIQKKLESLLNPDTLAEIKFKQAPTPSPSKSQISLSPLAKIALETADIDYRYPSPISDKSPPRIEQRHVPRPALLPTPALSVSPKPSRVIIAIPKPSDSSSRDDYAAVPDSPKRRKLNNNEINTEAALRLRSQREVADAALFRFQNTLLEIFEAQDQLEPDRSNGSTNEDAQYFYPNDEEEDSELRLSSNVLDRLQSSLKQLVSFGRVADVSSEQIKRLQQLCEHSIDAAQTLNLQPHQITSDEDRETWRRRIAKAENGASSSCTYIYTILGCQHDDSLVSAEVIRWLPNVLVNIFENCLIPIIEARPDGSNSELYEIGSAFQLDLKKLLETAKKLMDLLGSLCVQGHGASDIVNATEFLAAKLIFVQNAYNEKSAALGSQNYERARKQAMSALAKFYAAFPRERSAILDEVLSSLDKLPSTSRSARQYKLGDGKSIQLISALFMQLVQTASLEHSVDDATRKTKVSKHLKVEGASSDEDEDVMEVDGDTDPNQSGGKLSQLQRKADQLFNNSAKSAQEIIAYLVSKASKVSKSGDSPYRNVLDLFVEDLVNVLPLSEWPSAELLLRILAARMTDLATHEKAASSKNMALECLGTMGSAISILRVSVRNLSSTLSRDGEGHASRISMHLVGLAEDQLVAGLRKEDVIGSDGPFAITSRYFTNIANQSLRARSARSYYLAQYAAVVCLALKSGDDEDLSTELDEESSIIVSDLLEQIADASSETTTARIEDSITSNDAQLAYLLSILNLGFCRRFAMIVKTLSSSFSSDQAQVRSRSLKSVVAMLETDSALLDRDPTIADDVFKCASDDSAMVRDSALSLIAKFIISKAGLEEKGIKRLLECADDAKIGVRKRALGHLKDIYNQDSRPKLKAAIAQTYLQRTADLEESVSELAKRTLTEIWITPYLEIASAHSDSAKFQVAIEDLTSHIVSTLETNQSGLTVLLKEFVKWSFKSSKNTNQIGELCKRVVDVLFQSIITGEATQSSLMTLMAFAEAHPQSVAPQQLSNLRRYLKNIKSEDDLFMFKSVIVVFRYVLPRLSSAHHALLKDIQDDLMGSISKMGRRVELDEIMSCLRTIDGVLRNTFRLVKLTVSVIEKIANPKLDDDPRVKLLRIVGSIGKHIDLEGQATLLQAQLKIYKGGPVSGFLADTVYPFAIEGQPTAVRLIALESLGSICQAWPAQFNKRNMREIFYSVLAGEASRNVEPLEKLRMQTIALRMFDELYASRAVPRDESGKELEGDDQAQDLKKLGGSTKTRDEDSAVALITGEIFTRVLKIALAEQGEQALLSVQTLASISHQGMIHPKQSTAAFVALETSPDQRIRDIAQNAHQLLHQQHESVCEREYMHAIHEAFIYQKSLFHDTSGVSQFGKAKLSPCFEIVNTSGSKYVKKFLSNIVSRINTDYAKLQLGQDVPDHVLFVQFATQNLAFFEYAKMDELLHVILQLELAFSKNGAEIAQAIESTLFMPERENTLERHLEGLDPLQSPARSAPLNFVEVKRLAAAACAVTMISEARSHLRRLYGITRDVKAAMQQNKQTKEAAKAPQKIHGITGDRFWNNSRSILPSLSSEEGMIARCKDFVVLMAIDEEVRVGEEGDESRESPSVNADPDAWQGPQRGKKRKSNTGSVGGTPKKPRARPPKQPGGRRSTSVSSAGDPDADYEG